LTLTSKQLTRLSGVLLTGVMLRLKHRR